MIADSLVGLDRLCTRASPGHRFLYHANEVTNEDRADSFNVTRLLVRAIILDREKSKQTDMMIELVLLQSSRL